MIDNFDQLVARCTASRRRRMIRLSFMIVGTLLFVIAGIAGYQMWVDAHTAPQPVVKKTSLTAPKEMNATAPLPQEINQTQISQANLPVSVPTKAAVKAPAAAVPAAVAPVITPPAAPAAVAPKNNRLFEVNTQPYENPVDAYRSNPKYETALAAARDFYAQENFVDAAIWAKKANQLNREAEEAWLLYAKSYYAQGRKNEAIGILELYLNYKDSKAASELIRTWKLTNTN